MDRLTEFNERTLNRFWRYLPDLFYPRSVPLAVQGTVSPEPILFAKVGAGKFRPFKEGEVWGRDGESGWFRLSGSVPREWAGAMVVARLNFGGEACVFSAAGEPLQGLTNGSVFAHSYPRERFRLASPCKGGEKVELLVEAAASGLFGQHRKDDPAPERVMGEHYTGQLDCVRLCVFDEEVWHLYIETGLLISLAKSLPERDPQRAQIQHTLLKAATAFRYLEPNAAEVRKILAPVLAQKADGTRLTTTAVGHAHIDVAWLWPMRESIRKCARTFSSQLRLIERYPGYVFGASQAALYQFTKEHYPVLYKRIQKAVADKRWEAQGCMWVEADCNLPSGESLVRQVFYGKKFFKQEFGVDVRNLWLPDVFGYSAALPQILRLAGVDTFLTQKLSWNQFNRFPHHTFLWKGLDGTGIRTHFPPETTYNGLLESGALRRASENIEERAYLPEFITLFGVGDGGGGPLEEHIEAGLLAKDLAGMPHVQFGHAQDMFDRLKDRESELPVWNGELYFELHRGTYTTQSRTKRQNRLLELQLRRTEMLYSALPAPDYPHDLIEKTWKIVLTNQFHDIIPGSSIGKVYEVAEREYAEAAKVLGELEQTALHKLAAGTEKKGKTLSLVNTLSHAFKGLVHLSAVDGGALETADGVKIPLQAAAGGGAWAAVELSPLAAHEFKVLAGAPAAQTKWSPRGRRTGFVLENDLIRYEFSEIGRLDRIHDKELDRELMRKGDLGNVFSLYQDWPQNFDAWDIDINYDLQLLGHPQLESAKSVECGATAQAVHFTFKAGKASTIDQTVRLGANSKRLDFVTKVDWQETRTMLRVAFPVDVTAAEAVYETQFGIVRRPTHKNTSWDWARFEVCAHRFADLSDQHLGVALLNDCKYGYKVQERTLDLNLLRSPCSPDPTADRGEQLFTYSLLPHKGRFEESLVLAEAHALNQPPLTAAGSVGFRLPVEISGTGPVLEAVKKAENEKAWVLRFYEPRGLTTTCTLRTPHDDFKIWEAGILENPVNGVPVRDCVAMLHFRPFEIKTIIVRQR